MLILGRSVAVLIIPQLARNFGDTYTESGMNRFIEEARLREVSGALILFVLKGDFFESGD